MIRLPVCCWVVIAASEQGLVVLSQLSLTKLWSVQLSLNKLIGREQPAIHNFASDNRTKTRRKIKQRKRHSNIFIKNQKHKRRKQK